MGFSYDSRIRDDYLLVTCTGAPESPEEFFEYIRSSILKARANDIQYVLFNESEATLKFQVYDAVLMSEMLDKEGLQTFGIRGAVVCNPHDFTACKYFETSLRNRAFNVMMFDDIEKGKAWLLKDR
jgi:hypothetical protein